MPGVDPRLDHLIDTYCLAWSDPSPERRHELLATVWAPGATYTDPTVHTVGADELLAHISTVIARRPGSQVLRTSPLDTHHNLTRFAWHVLQADGTTLPEGLDLAEFSADGRISRIIGFFGPIHTM